MMNYTVAGWTKCAPRRIRRRAKDYRVSRRGNLTAHVSDAEEVIEEIFKVGCAERILLKKLWHSVRPVTRAKGESVYGPAREGDMPEFRASLEKNRERLGYELSVSLDEGPRRTVEWLAERQRAAEECS